MKKFFAMTGAAILAIASIAPASAQNNNVFFVPNAQQIAAGQWVTLLPTGAFFFDGYCLLVLGGYSCEATILPPQQQVIVKQPPPMYVYRAPVPMYRPFTAGVIQFRGPYGNVFHFEWRQ